MAVQQHSQTVTGYVIKNNQASFPPHFDFASLYLLLYLLLSSMAKFLLLYLLIRFMAKLLLLDLLISPMAKFLLLDLLISPMAKYLLLDLLISSIAKLLLVGNIIYSRVSSSLPKTPYIHTGSFTCF